MWIFGLIFWGERTESIGVWGDGRIVVFGGWNSAIEEKYPA
jgi:hypothetical protein